MVHSTGGAAQPQVCSWHHWITSLKQYNEERAKQHGRGRCGPVPKVNKSNLSTSRNHSVILLHVGHAWRFPWIPLSPFLQSIPSADHAEVGFQRANGAALPVTSLGALSWSPSTAMGRDTGDTGAVGTRKQGKKIMCASKMRAEWGLG